MDQLVELEKYLKDLIKFQDNDIAKLTTILILDKVHRMMEEYMKDIMRTVDDLVKEGKDD